jgi:hypothetical protein
MNSANARQEVEMSQVQGAPWGHWRGPAFRNVLANSDFQRFVRGDTSVGVLGNVGPRGPDTSPKSLWVRLCPTNFEIRACARV